MTDDIQAFPLCWPGHWPRTATAAQGDARFFGTTSREHRYGDGSTWTWKVKRAKTIDEARRFLRSELERLGARDVIISSNMRTRNDGEIRASAAAPADPGVAVYFKLRQQDRCFPCDKWSTVADNLWAIAKSIEAMRGLERWGAERMVDAAFTGFKALPETTGGKPWWEVLDLGSGAPVAEIRAQYRALSLQRHPDKEGGSVEAFRELQEALGQGLAVRGEAR